MTSPERRSAYPLRRRRGPRGPLIAACVAAFAASGCSRKLSSGGSAFDSVAYDILKMDRGTGYYFQTLQSAHDRTNFCYRCTDDPFLADKCVDAIRHLGDANYDRLEGEVQVVLLLSDVLLEDPIVLARVQSAEALTKLALKLPIAPIPDRPENGLRYLAQLKELDAMHDEEGRLRSDTPATRQRVVQIFDDIGSYRFPKLLDTKNGLRFFPARTYVTRETDPVLRAAIDRAMARRARAVVLVSLTDAVQEPSAPVREAALKGLRVLSAPDALESAVDRIPVESSGLVRVAIADYLGAIGGPVAAKALVGLLDDDDASVRHRAHEALARTSGRDLGREPLAWAAWADGKPIPPSAMPPGSPLPGVSAPAIASPRSLAGTPPLPSAPPPGASAPPSTFAASRPSASTSAPMPASIPPPPPPPSAPAPSAPPPSPFVPAVPPVVARPPYVVPPGPTPQSLVPGAGVRTSVPSLAAPPLPIPMPVTVPPGALPPPAHRIVEGR